MVTSAVQLVHATFNSNIPAVKQVAGAVEDVRENLEEGNCLAAAESAGVPDNVIALFKRSVEDLTLIERGLVKAAIEAGGLSEHCADLAG